MWPKLLDLTRDECRGLLRRLELESYSTVVGAFRAQGKLSSSKLRILKDLRGAFHISDDRHKAEIRRVVNDEYLSTVANMMYGPNSEIEWNKEGSRGFLIIDRQPSQTALTAIANGATDLGEKLNKNLSSPMDIFRERLLTSQNEKDVLNSNVLVVDDPHKFEIKRQNSTSNSKVDLSRITSNSTAKKREIQSIDSDGMQKKDQIKNEVIDNRALNPLKNDHGFAASTKHELVNNRRRKSTTSVINSVIPPKLVLLYNRRKNLTGMKSNVNNCSSENNTDHLKFNEKQLTSSEQIETNPTPLNATVKESNYKVDSIKFNARDAYNAANTSRVFEIIGGDTVKAAFCAVKRSSPISKKQRLEVLQTDPNAHQTKIQGIKSTQSNIIKSHLPFESNNVEYLVSDDGNTMLNSIETHQKQSFTSDPQSMNTTVGIKDKSQLLSSPSQTHRKDLISIPTARNPNIVKTNDKTIMHVTPIQQTSKSPSSSANNISVRTQKKQIVQVISPQSQPRTVTIYPNNVVFKARLHPTIPSDATQEQVYETQVDNWQEYDPRDIIYTENMEDEMITEEYITPEEFSPDNVIEMVYDSTN